MSASETICTIMIAAMSFWQFWVATELILSAYWVRLREEMLLTRAMLSPGLLYQS